MATATSVNKTSLLPNNSEPQPDIIIDTNNIFTVAAAGTTQATAYAIGNAQPFIIISNNTAANGVVLPTGRNRPHGDRASCGNIGAESYPLRRRLEAETSTHSGLCG